VPKAAAAITAISVINENAGGRDVDFSETGGLMM
jgi:hypothetical protein